MSCKELGWYDFIKFWKISSLTDYFLVKITTFQLLRTIVRYHSAIEMVVEHHGWQCEECLELFNY